MRDDSGLLERSGDRCAVQLGGVDGKAHLDVCGVVGDVEVLTGYGMDSVDVTVGGAGRRTGAGVAVLLVIVGPLAHPGGQRAAFLKGGDVGRDIGENPVPET